MKGSIEGGRDMRGWRHTQEGEETCEVGGRETETDVGNSEAGNRERERGEVETANRSHAGGVK